MARQRKPHAVEHHHSSSKFTKKTPHVERDPNIFSYWKRMLAVICLVIAACVGYMGYLETRVNTPFDNKKMVLRSGLEVPERYWGSYRPGAYFGMKTRDPYSLVTGLMWYFPQRLRPDGAGIRHWCEEGDGLQRYGWLQHDGRHFGLQEIQDGPFLMTTSFVKRAGGNYGGEWTGRVSVTTADEQYAGESVSLLVYAALEEKAHGWIKPARFGSPFTGVLGETEGLGTFSLKIQNRSGMVQHESYLSTLTQGLHVLKESVLASLRLVSDRQQGGVKRIVLPGELLPVADGKPSQPNFIVTQITATVPFEMDIVFEGASHVDRPYSLVGDAYTSKLVERQNDFNRRFEETYKLSSKGYDEKHVTFAKAALSNLIGGIGYFYGASRVESAYTRGPVPYWKAPLYTAVPSRSFFPRGFLWDEGFHGLLLATWDLDVELDIITHWFDLMNVEGWIPREQILGQEALSKVPEQFVTQRNSNANPPTFFLTLDFMMRRYARDPEANKKLAGTLERLFPRLQAWFDWFNTTQAGDLPGTYRWRGRDAATVRELNPITLTSGLDDYPRASHPNLDERHIDLRCWVALAARALADMAQLIGHPSLRHSATYDFLADNKLLDELHWSPRTEAYADFGLHTDAVVLKRPPPSRSPSPHTPQNQDKVRVVLKDPELRFVDSTFGYVSLFPFLLQVLDPHSPRLRKLLDDIRNPELLWTDYGLRSLARTAPLYMKRNTEHDPPYWRGPIWININYLAVRALHHYGHTDGPYRDKALAIYQSLRSNIIRNMLKEYHRTGYIWEQYNDKTGEGQRSHPFTGWSSLVLLMMAEIY